jgi:hypothetical protein
MAIFRQLAPVKPEKTMSDTSHASWFRLYEAALLETDPKKVVERTNLALNAIRNRVASLTHEHAVGTLDAEYVKDRRALQEALQILLRSDRAA